MAALSFDGMSLKKAKKALAADPTASNVAAFQAYVNSGGKAGSLSQEDITKAMDFSRSVFNNAGGSSGPAPTPANNTSITSSLMREAEDLMNSWGVTGSQDSGITPDDIFKAFDSHSDMKLGDAFPTVNQHLPKYKDKTFGDLTSSYRRFEANGGNLEERLTSIFESLDARAMNGEQVSEAEFLSGFLDGFFDDASGPSSSPEPTPTPESTVSTPPSGESGGSTLNNPNKRNGPIVNDRELSQIEKEGAYSPNPKGFGPAGNPTVNSLNNAILGDADGFYAARRKVGHQYDKISRDFNSKVNSLRDEFRSANPTGDFLEELKNPNSDTANRLFEYKRSLSEGMYDAESRLNALREDIYDTKGRSGLFGGKGARGTEAMAARHASNDLTRVTDEFGEFYSIKGQDGNIVQYRTHKQITEGVSSGIEKQAEQLQARTISADGKTISAWNSATDAQIKARSSAIESGEKFITDSGTIKEMVGDVVNADVSGATAVQRTVTGLDDIVKNVASQNNHVPGGNYRARRAAASDYVADSRVASKIANTATGESSGIFSQIAKSAAEHPVIAAGIAIGGFALASKALDKRRESDY